MSELNKRFRYNDGVYDIRRSIGKDWVSAFPPITGSYFLANYTLESTQKRDPEGNYKLFYLSKDRKDVIKWIPVTTSSHYHSENQKELLKIFYQLNLKLDPRGYGILSGITGISTHALKKLNRNPHDTRFTPLTNAGLLYIQYCIQEHLKK